MFFSSFICFKVEVPSTFLESPLPERKCPFRSMNYNPPTYKVFYIQDLTVSLKISTITGFTNLKVACCLVHKQCHLVVSRHRIGALKWLNLLNQFVVILIKICDSNHKQPRTLHIQQHLKRHESINRMLILKVQALWICHHQWRWIDPYWMISCRFGLLAGIMMMLEAFFIKMSFFFCQLGFQKKFQGVGKYKHNESYVQKIIVYYWCFIFF